MAKASDTKLAYALLDSYTSLYRQRYNRQCSVNKYRDKWAMLDVIESVGYDRARQLVEYYFSLSSRVGHTLQWFLYNFDRLDEMLRKSEEDSRKRMEIREKTKRMVEEVVEH